MNLRTKRENIVLHIKYEHRGCNVAGHMERALIRPFKLLGTQSIVEVLALYMTYLYDVLYLSLLIFSDSLNRRLSRVHRHRQLESHLSRLVFVGV